MSRDCLRTILAILSTLIATGLTGYVIWRWRTTPARDKIDTDNPGSDKEQREQRDVSIEHFKDLSGKLFDVALLLLGIVWGLVLADKVRLDVSRTADVVQFVATNFLLCLSLYCHVVYRRRMAILLWDLAPLQPSVFSPLVDYLFEVQWWSFLLSVLTGVFTIVSVKLVGAA